MEKRIIIMNIDTLKLDKSKIYCQKCILEGEIIPLEFPNNDYIKTNCKHTGRNCNTLRFHNNEWHLFYGFKKDAKCRTCQAKRNLEVINDLNGEPKKKLKEWYNSYKCKEILKQNANNWRNSEEGKNMQLKNCLICNRIQNNEISMKFYEICKVNTLHNENIFTIYDPNIISVGIFSFVEEVYLFHCAN